jgi:hypothetical protein
MYCKRFHFEITHGTHNTVHCICRELDVENKSAQRSSVREIDSVKDEQKMSHLATYRRLKGIAEIDPGATYEIYV